MKGASRFSLPPEERIKHQKMFDLLFSGSQSLKVWPVRLLYREIPFDPLHPCRIGISVPKRWLKFAHDRNRQKRLAREAYRLNKETVNEHCRRREKGLAMVFIFQTVKPLSFAETQEKIILLLQRLTGGNEKDAE